MVECKNETVKKWIDECAAMTQPDKIVWIDGSDSQREEMRQLAVDTGEMIKLNQEKLPGCYYYRTQPNDVARDESKTVICTSKREDVGPTNNWVEKDRMYAIMSKIFKGSMKGRTMYVIPFSMGVVGTEFSKIGIELTDSIYVVLNMLMMTRVGDKVVEHLNKGEDFVKCLHSKAEIDNDKKYIAHFPEDNTIWSVNSAYGGNVLLGKKCFALRIGSVLGKREGWMAEHMLILGIEKPNGEKRYICAAFPSACGKTNLAMLTPPKHLKEKGYKIWTVGDDIAWIRVGKDGRLYAVNPESGFFGVAPGTNSKSNPIALATTKKNSIFTNVARNLDDNTVWWEKLDEPAPTNGEDWLGNPWNGQTSDKVGANPNSRFTAPGENCPTIAEEFFTGEGVPIDAIVFGGRRAKAAPLVFEARDWDAGVFVGSIMSSETTAAITGQVGVVRYDPMAMLPFCGYHMADYWQHWLDMGKKTSKQPKIFNVNWFRTDDEGNFLWPGFGDNLRVILWMLDRADGKVDADEIPLGFVPKKEDLDMEGIDVPDAVMDEILSLDKDVWKNEINGIEKHYDKFDRIPQELLDEFENLKNKVNE